MYSVILMAALTAGSATTTFGHGGMGHGSPAVVSYGCCGGCCGGSYYSGCHGGCCGGWSNMPSVYSYGCSGSGCYGCYGYANYSGYSCFGCGGGSYYGGYGYGSSCYDCGCSGSSVIGYGTVVTPSYQMMPSTQTMPSMGNTFPSAPMQPRMETSPAPKMKTSAIENNRARVAVSLPADAKLFIDGKATTTTSEKRVFQTPVLDQDKTYVYELRAEVQRQGQVMTETQRIVLHPGQLSEANFPNLGMTATASVGGDK